jgi:hypothetical protein
VGAQLSKHHRFQVGKTAQVGWGLSGFRRFGSQEHNLAAQSSYLQLRGRTSAKCEQRVKCVGELAISLSLQLAMLWSGHFFILENGNTIVCTNGVTMVTISATFSLDEVSVDYHVG